MSPWLSKVIRKTFVRASYMNTIHGIHPSGHRRSSDAQIWFQTNLWEGRYTAQALLDEASILSCMCYVDLNPVRAKITEKLEESNNTSIQKRIKAIQSNPQSDLTQNIEAISGQIQARQLNIKLKEYIELVEWTGQSIVHANKASIPSHIIPIIQRLNLQQNHWLKHIEDYGKNYKRVVGHVEAIREKAKALGLRCLHGISAAKVLYQTPQ